jgi:uncharacterized membrane protein
VTGKDYLAYCGICEAACAVNSLSQTQPQVKGQGQSQIQPRIKPNSVVYWMRVLIAIAAGFANHLLGITQASFGDAALYTGIGLGVLFYLLSVLIVRYVLHYGEVELKGKNRDITLGGGTFIVLWIMVSVLLNTLLV